jgi:hypothetical protein
VRGVRRKCFKCGDATEKLIETETLAQNKYGEEMSRG